MHERTTILVVDNDLAIAMVIADVLEDAGYTVRTAVTLAAARAVIADVRPTLLLLDLHFFERTSVEFAHEIKRDGHQTIPIIMMTTEPPTTRMQIQIPKGIECYLIKPFDIVDLLAYVAGAISRPSTDSVETFSACE
jgi:DNA-binding response OmpR family regulator